MREALSLSSAATIALVWESGVWIRCQEPVRAVKHQIDLSAPDNRLVFSLVDKRRAILLGSLFSAVHETSPPCE